MREYEIQLEYAYRTFDLPTDDPVYLSTNSDSIDSAFKWFNQEVVKIKENSNCNFLMIVAIRVYDQESNILIPNEIDRDRMGLLSRKIERGKYER